MGRARAPLDGRAIDDVAAMADLLRERVSAPTPPLALRGSSMGGYLALIAAAAGAGAEAVVAICPANAALLRRGLATGALRLRRRRPRARRAARRARPRRRARGLEIPVLLLHAEGDEQVPVELSRELAAELRHPRSRLIVIPGGHHRSIQHDDELQAVSAQFLTKALAARTS